MGLDSLRFSGDVPEPGRVNFKTLAAAISRFIVDDDVIDSQLFNCRQETSRVALVATAEGVIVGTIGAFLDKQVHTAERNVQNP